MDTNNSKKYKLNKVDLQKIGKGGVIAVSGALLTYLSMTIVDVDFGTWTPLVTSLGGIIVNALSRWLNDFSQEI